MQSRSYEREILPNTAPLQHPKAAGDSGCDFAPATAKQEQEEEGSS